MYALAGFGPQKAQWISGLNNIFYMVSPAPPSAIHTSNMTSSSQLSSASSQLTALDVASLYIGVPLSKALPCSSPARSSSLAKMPPREATTNRLVATVSQPHPWSSSSPKPSARPGSPCHGSTRPRSSRSAFAQRATHGVSLVGPSVTVGV